MPQPPKELARPLRRPAHGLWFGVALLALQACGNEPGFGSDSGVDTGLGDVIVAPLQYIEFSGCPSGGGTARQVCPTVNLETIGCSAAIECRDGFLNDPSTGEPALTFTTSLACGFDERPEPSDPPEVFDSLPTFAAKVTCIDGGGDDVEPPTPAFGEYRVYSQIINETGDFFLNTARIAHALFPLGTTATSCAIDAWASPHFQRIIQDPPESREAVVLHSAPVVNWHGAISANGTSQDCSDMSVRSEVVFSAIHDLADPSRKGDYPGRHGSLLLRPETFVDPTGSRPFHALEGIALGDSRFPVPPNDAPASFSSPVFSVTYPFSLVIPLTLIGRPAAITPKWSCVETDASGAITFVGVVFTFDGYESRLQPGVLVINRDGGTSGWDCARGGPSNFPMCRLYGPAYDTRWATLVPCLTGQIPSF